MSHLSPIRMLFKSQMNLFCLQEPQEQPQNGNTSNEDPESSNNGAPVTSNTPSAGENVEENCKQTAEDAQQNGENQDSKHSSLDPTGDPTKPDLLGDIVVTNNGESTNEEVNENDNDDLEKGIVDMNISEQTKDEEKIMNE